MTQRKHSWRSLLFAGLAAVLITGCSSSEQPQGQEQGHEHSDEHHEEAQTPADAKEVKIKHMHGLGYSGDGNSLYVANHGAFLAYQPDGWLPVINPHDFMGMSATDKGLYVSGHPGTTDLKNPLGLSKSTDGGKTVQPLAFYGEIDFHVMTGSYYTGTIYVFNEEPHPKLKEGLSYTKDEGKTWTHVDIKGLSAPISALAIHPSQDNVVVFGTEKGLAISEDYGATIKTEFNTGSEVTAVSFDLSQKDNRTMYVATAGDKTELLRVTPSADTFNKQSIYSGDKKEVITFISTNPKRPEIAVSTDKNNVYLFTEDGKQTALTEDGTVKIEKK